MEISAFGERVLTPGEEFPDLHLATSHCLATRYVISHLATLAALPPCFPFMTISQRLRHYYSHDYYNDDTTDLHHPCLSSHILILVGPVLTLGKQCPNSA